MQGFVRFPVSWTVAAATAIIAVSAPLTAFSQEDTPKKKSSGKASASLHDQFSGQGYGVGGCGLGSIIFGAKPGMVQVFSSTTNGIYSNQTFGISSGTSNCDIPSMGHQAAAFIELNQEMFRKEVARGGGETVDGVAFILKCSDHDAFGAKLRENSSAILEDGISTLETTRRILRTIEANDQLKTTCAKLG